ncbi:MAG: esterase/lipase family protein [Gulosibacter sp.]|uniref:esterase/lipase family protein n=1 Tax=Gulosibacter sp. TaxID=2817531 RepID=UPI003F911BA0
MTPQQPVRLRWQLRVWRALVRAWASTADSLYWTWWQARSAGMRAQRKVRGRRAVLLADPSRVDPEKPVVVALSGLMTSWEFLSPLTDGLMARGFQVAVLPQLGLNMSSVEALSAHVHRFLDTHGELQPVVFVTHSKGGLVAKRVLLDDPEGELVVGAVALAAPFAGATAARYVHGLTKFGREIVTLRVGTPAQLQLEQMDAQDHRIASIAPVYDEIVGVRGRVRGGRNRAVSSLGHNRLLSDDRVHSLVVVEINRMWETWQEHLTASPTTPPKPV